MAHPAMAVMGHAIQTDAARGWRCSALLGAACSTLRRRSLGTLAWRWRDLREICACCGLGGRV